MIVKDSITDSMKWLADKKDTVFLGENIINSGRIYGTLNKVPIEKCIEMPVAENLIAGCAIGLAIRGYHPICIFQRMDFMYIAADAIINHACLIPKMSGGSVKLPIIFRTIKGSLNDKFYVGMQHSKDLTKVFEDHIDILRVPSSVRCIENVYKVAYRRNAPCLIVEDYSEFNTTISKKGDKNG